MSYLCGKSCYESECTECAVVADALEERGVVPDYNLQTGLAYNPQPWSLVNLAEIALAIDDGNDEPQYTWIVRLMDGRWAAVRGWHDYTWPWLDCGWDCQSGLRTEWYATKDDAMRTLVDWERAAAGMPT